MSSMRVRTANFRCVGWDTARAGAALQWIINLMSWMQGRQYSRLELVLYVVLDCVVIVFTSGEWEACCFLALRFGLCSRVNNTLSQYKEIGGAVILHRI